MKLNVLFITLIFCILIQTGCTESPHTVEIKKLAQPNPTSYVFNMPLNKLRDTVIKLFEVSPQMDDSILASVFMDRILKDRSFPITFSPETSDKAIFGTDYFKRKETVNNVYLCPMGSYWYSPLYYHHNKPFLFSTSFAIQFRAVSDEFKSVSDQQTMLTVIDVSPEISNGTKCCSPHGNYARTESVKPTTVEEYTLILYLARKLGVKGLQPMMLPK